MSGAQKLGHEAIYIFGFLKYEDMKEPGAYLPYPVPPMEHTHHGRPPPVPGFGQRLLRVSNSVFRVPLGLR
jgi:hypothetical protein